LHARISELNKLAGNAGIGVHEQPFRDFNHDVRPSQPQALKVS